MDKPNCYNMAVADLQRADIATGMAAEIVKRYATQVTQEGGPSQVDGSMNELAALLAQLVQNNARVNCNYSVYPFSTVPEGAGGAGVIQQILPANPNRKYLAAFATDGVGIGGLNGIIDTFLLFEQSNQLPQQLNAASAYAYKIRGVALLSLGASSDVHQIFTPAPTNAISILGIRIDDQQTGTFGVVIEGV